MFSTPRKPHVLSTAQFKALSTESRARILKMLGARKHTQAEIAEQLGIAAPTVKEHLDALVRAKLIIKEETDRKWKYFDLTATGRAILNPEEKTFMFLLITSAFAALGGASAWMRIALAPAETEMMKTAVAEASRAADTLMQAAPILPPMPAQEATPWGLIIYAAVMLCLASLTFYYGWKSRKNKDLARRLSKA